MNYVVEKIDANNFNVCRERGGDSVAIFETQKGAEECAAWFNEGHRRLAKAAPSLPTGAKERKATPLHSGLVAYFKDALVAIAQLSYAGNEQHNPGEPLHWARDKSDDHEDALLRHHWEAGTVDEDGHRHSTKRAWRALAALQLELEAAEVMAPGIRIHSEKDL